MPLFLWLKVLVKVKFLKVRKLFAFYWSYLKFIVSLPCKLTYFINNRGKGK